MICDDYFNGTCGRKLKAYMHTKLVYIYTFPMVVYLKNS